MSLEIVNGFVCRDCTDVERAKRNIDPARPRDDPRSADHNPSAEKADHGPAFRLSGALARAETAGSSSDALPPVTENDDTERTARRERVDVRV